MPHALARPCRTSCGRALAALTRGVTGAARSVGARERVGARALGDRARAADFKALLPGSRPPDGGQGDERVLNAAGPATFLPSTHEARSATAAEVTQTVRVVKVNLYYESIGER